MKKSNVGNKYKYDVKLERRIDAKTLIIRSFNILQLRFKPYTNICAAYIIIELLLVVFPCFMFLLMNIAYNVAIKEFEKWI